MKVLFVFGTRPEAIKMAPVIKVFKEDSRFTVKVLVTGQHRSMLDQVLTFFNIVPDYDINLMKPNQTLFDITSDVLKGLEQILNEVKPDLLFVQGDTTTAFAGSLAAFYKQVPVGHIEAGLRSGNPYSPFPEEINRKLVGQISKYHFAPTIKAANNLIQEGISEHIHTVGNTVIDALIWAKSIVNSIPQERFYKHFESIDLSKKIVLVTGHRRESFGQPFKNICESLRQLSSTFNNVEFVYPVHFNPNVRQVVNETLNNIDNVHLIEPLDYPHLVWIMEKSYLVLTDSGGIQEEAPALGKPVLVMRDVTERQEGIDAGTARLVGTNQNKIIGDVTELLLDEMAYNKMAKAVNPYGDGTSSRQILDIVISNK